MKKWFEERKYTVSDDECIRILENKERIFSEIQVKNFTCVVADIDTTEETASVATAGHPECYVLSSGSVSVIKPRGPLVGFSETYEYPSQTHPFK